MRPGLTTVLRDTAAWVGGWVIMFKQAGLIFEPPSQVNETLVWVAAVLIGAPGLVSVATARLGNGPPTGSVPLSDQPPESPPSSSGASPREAEPA